MNDHQIEFVRNVVERMGTVICVENIEMLGDIINNYDKFADGRRIG